MRRRKADFLDVYQILKRNENNNENVFLKTSLNANRLAKHEHSLRIGAQ